MKSFTSFAQRVALIQSFSVQNFKMIWQLTNILWQSNNSRNYGDPFCVYNMFTITYAWKKNNHPIILKGKIHLFSSISATNTDKTTQLLMGNLLDLHFDSEYKNFIIFSPARSLSDFEDCHDPLMHRMRADRANQCWALSSMWPDSTRE